jgi:hypothetical protein
MNFNINVIRSIQLIYTFSILLKMHLDIFCFQLFCIYKNELTRIVFILLSHYATNKWKVSFKYIINEILILDIFIYINWDTFNN